jgi:SAM-dependent methyltransferase
LVGQYLQIYVKSPPRQKPGMLYPPPLTSLEEHSELYKHPDRRRAMFHLMWPAGRPYGNQEILIAGCGTSQAAIYALREPDARITAIDIRDTSLRHTRDLQRKYNLKNLELHQLPIERVREMGRSFDLVVCTGVLHHLSDPDHGLCALRDVLRPSGAMRLMVYARYGRAGIYMMLEYCRLLGISSSAKDLHSAPPSQRCRRATRFQASWAARRISCGQKRWQMRSFIPRIVPIPSRSSMHGSIAAACASVAGRSRPPIWPNAAW